MKPFNLERALAGDPVVSKEGDPVKVVFVSKVDDRKPILGVTNPDTLFESDRWYTPEGKYYPQDIEPSLFMAPKTQKYYLNIYRNDYTKGLYCTDLSTEKLTNTSERIIKTLEVEIEE